MSGQTALSGDSPFYVAINMSKVANNEKSFELMQHVGPKVCITTANHPGFIGFQANIQTGVLALAGRYGGGSAHMENTLNPIRNYQYTMWKSYTDHDEFHMENFDRIFELCGSCLSMVIEGPWEPVYEVVAAKMPPVRSMGSIASLAGDVMEQKDFVRFVTPQRCVALTEHAAKPGRESAFEKGVVDTLEALSTSTGFLGYMVLRQMGVCAIGSFMLDSKSTAEALMTLGANPPSDPKPAFATPDARPTPTEYIIHTEWEAVELARLGFGKVLVNHEIRKIHDQGVMDNIISGPYITFYTPMMEEPSWREYAG